MVDEGAKCAIVNGRKSLLPKGIISVNGHFLAGSVVFVIDEQNHLLAKGIVKYSSDEIKLIKGKNTSDLEIVLGYPVTSEVIHANDLVILEGEDYGKIK